LSFYVVLWLFYFVAKTMSKKLTWKIERRKLSELKPLEKNPFGKSTPEKLERLKKKLDNLGVFETPTRHHALMTLWGADAEIDCMVPGRKLTESERKEIIVTSNAHEGEWDLDILRADFDDLDLDFLNLDLSVNDNPVPDNVAQIAVGMGDVDFEAQFNKIKDKDVPMPIVPEFFESHECFIIPVHNEIDERFIREVFALTDNHESPSSDGKICKSNVINVDEIRRIWIK